MAVKPMRTEKKNKGEHAPFPTDFVKESSEIKADGRSAPGDHCRGPNDKKKKPGTRDFADSLRRFPLF